jgi:hypothetical protein
MGKLTNAQLQDKIRCETQLNHDLLIALDVMKAKHGKLRKRHHTEWATHDTLKVNHNRLRESHERTKLHLQELADRHDKLTNNNVAQAIEMSNQLANNATMRAHNEAHELNRTELHVEIQMLKDDAKEDRETFDHVSRQRDAYIDENQRLRNQLEAIALTATIHLGE